MIDRQADFDYCYIWVAFFLYAVIPVGQVIHGAANVRPFYISPVNIQTAMKTGERMLGQVAERQNRKSDSRYIIKMNR